MISVDEAIKSILSDLPTTSTETISIFNAVGRVLAQKVISKINQPPFSSSAMDGYAIPDKMPQVGSNYKVIGGVSAGTTFNKSIGKDETVRIFTGAPIPKGTEKVIIQENIKRSGETVKIISNDNSNNYIRPQGCDYQSGTSIEPNSILDAPTLALIASMNISDVTVYKKPTVAIITTGNELIMPGEKLKKGKIVSSNSIGVSASLMLNGANTKILPIAKDDPESLKYIINISLASDFIVTIGGASVGEYDIVKDVLLELGLKIKFSKVSMRPGKPLFSGKLGSSTVIGLPGNPVSALICTEIFIVPAIKKFLKLNETNHHNRFAELSHNLPKNGPRTHYMRAKLDEVSNVVKVDANQDSSLLSILAKSNALVIREPNAKEIQKGKLIPIMLFN